MIMHIWQRGRIRIMIRTELEKIFRDINKNIEYGSQISCKEGDDKNDEKKEGDEKTKMRNKNEVT